MAKLPTNSELKESLISQFKASTVFEEIKNSPKDIIAIVGPTCTGKTALSLELSQVLYPEAKLEIINCDSRVVFQEMNIGTAKPNKFEVEEVPHHLIDFKKPNEIYSAGEYQEDFDKVYTELKTKREAEGLTQYPTAITVGGTGFYIKAALENLDMPEVKSDFALRDELNAKPLDELNKMLNELDPKAHQIVDTLNKIRVVRAIETVKLGGKPLAELRKKSEDQRYNTHYIGLNFRKRRTLYDLINKRVVTMVKKGLVHEVEKLVKEYGVTDTLMRTIGYAEIIRYLQGEYSLSAAVRAIQKNTRRYAKRQISWFNSNENMHWIYLDDPVEAN